MISHKKFVARSRAWVPIILASMALTSVDLNAETLAHLQVPSGFSLFSEHCAQCHGVDGTGNGPMAKILTVHPADLTSLSKKNGGEFPAARIADIIRYGGDIQGHGDHIMPLWGRLFSSEGGAGKGGGAYSRRAVIELKNYIETIQAK